MKTPSNIFYSATIVSVFASVVAFSVTSVSAQVVQTLQPAPVPTALLTTATTTIPGCPVITAFLKMGTANDTAQVKRLQSFLKVHESIDVDVTGIFDQKTKVAVETFQRKYMSDIMTPWGATRPSGVVYFTTAKKINQLACGGSMTLNGEEASMTIAYKNAAAAAESQAAASAVSVTAPTTPVTTPVTTMPAASSETLQANQATSDMVVGPTIPGMNANTAEVSAQSATDNTASVGQVSVWSRFKNFVKNILTK